MSAARKVVACLFAAYAVLLAPLAVAGEPRSIGGVLAGCYLAGLAWPRKPRSSS